MTIQRNKFTLSSVGFGLLIFIFTFLIVIGILGWHSMTQAGNESNAIQFISQIRLKQYKYNSEREKGFTRSFVELGEFGSMGEERAGDEVIFSGYKFTMEVKTVPGIAPSTYSIRADPQVRYGFVPTGTRHFYFDSSLGTIKCTEENRPATADDQPM